jgi:hypothetical protein
MTETRAATAVPNLTRSRSFKYGTVSLQQLSRIMGVPVKLIRRESGRPGPLAQFVLTRAFSTGGRSPLFSADIHQLRLLNHLLIDARIKLEAGKLTLFDVAEATGEHPLSILKCYIEQGRLAQFVHNKEDVTNRGQIPIFKQEDLGAITNLLGRSPLTAEQMQKKLDGLRALRREHGEDPAFQSLDCHISLLTKQLGLLRDYAEDSVSERPLLPSDQFQDACRASLVYLASLQQHFRNTLGIAEDFKFLSAVRVPDFIEGQKILSLSEFITAAEAHVKDDAAKAELHHQLIAYAMQAGDQASLSVTHHLLQSIENGTLNGFAVFLDRFSHFRCLLPVRYSSISTQDFMAASVGALSESETATVLLKPATQSVGIRSREKHLRAFKDLESNAARVRTVWQEGSNSPLGYDDFLAFLSENRKGSIARRLAQFHPAVFTRVIEEIAKARNAGVAMLSIQDFHAAPAPFGKDLRGFLYYLLAICRMDPSLKEINFEELHARLKQLADNFKTES